MSDKHFEPLEAYDDEDSRIRRCYPFWRRYAWLRTVMIFCVISAILSTLWPAPFMGAMGAPFSAIPWPWALFAFWGVMMLLRGGRRAYRGDAVQWEGRTGRHMRRERRYADLDDLFEKPKRGLVEDAYEKPKHMVHVARLGDDGEMIYDDEPRRSASHRTL